MSAAFDRSAAHRASPTRYFQPGAVAGSGSVLWILDVSHPTVLRRGPGGSVTACEVPGEIRGSGIVGWRQRWLHADEFGCWVVGADGVAHCDHSGTVRLIDDASVSVSALAQGVLASACGERDGGGNALIRLWALDAPEPTIVPVPGEVQDIQLTRDGFLVSMRTGTQGSGATVIDRGQWCARVRVDGRVVLGDPWPRAYWGVGGVSVVGLGAPVAVSRSARS